MKRSRLTMVLAVGGIVAVACTGDRGAGPAAPEFNQSAPQIQSSPQLALAQQILVKIDALFPRPVLKPLAVAKFGVIAIKQAAHQTAEARALMLAFVDWTLKLYGAQRLIGDQSAPTQANVRALIDLLYQFVGLTPPNLPGGALGSDGATAVVGPNGGLVVTPSRLSGVNFPAGTFSQMVLVTISRTENQVDPLPTNLTQFPPFYAFTTFPTVPQFGQPAVVGICVTDPAPADLRLAHPSPVDPSTIEILPLAPVPFLECPEFPSPGLGSLKLDRRELARTGWRGVRDRLVALPFLVLSPAPARASTMVMPGGLGGRTTSFSPFGAVQFNRSCHTGRAAIATTC